MNDQLNEETEIPELPRGTSAVTMIIYTFVDMESSRSVFDQRNGVNPIRKTSQTH